MPSMLHAFCRLLILVCELVFAVSIFIVIVLRLLLFVWIFKGFIFQTLFRNAITVFNSLNPDQANSLFAKVISR